MLKTSKPMKTSLAQCDWDLAVQHGVLPVVLLLRCIHGDVVVGLGLLVLLLVLQLRTETGS